MGLTPKRLLLAGVTLVVGLVAIALFLLRMLSSPFETLALYDVEGDALSDQSANPAHLGDGGYRMITHPSCYWLLDTAGQFDFQTEPTVGAGQLSDDVGSIRATVSAGDEQVLWRDLAHLVGVLQRIAALSVP